jgi:hypothetical protein
MTTLKLRTIALASALAVTAWAAPSRADVDVHVGIGIPAPHIVVERPPRLVVVPGYPSVHYAPELSVNFFAYGGRYYTYDDDRWYVARGYGGPWAYVEPRHVPRVFLDVPHEYYRVPPRLVGGGHWHSDRHYYRGDRDRDHGKHHKKWKKHGKRHRH